MDTAETLRLIEETASAVRRIKAMALVSGAPAVAWPLEGLHDRLVPALEKLREEALLNEVLTKGT